MQNKETRSPEISRQQVQKLKHHNLFCIILDIDPTVPIQLNVVLWYLQTCMVDSYLLTLPESESAECQIGTLGEKLYEQKTKWPPNVTCKIK